MIIRNFLLAGPALVAILALSACSASFSVGQQSASNTTDCVGKDGKCSVAEHEAQQPVVAGDLDARIHDYLLAHSEVIAEVQRAAGQKQAEARQVLAKKALADNRDAVFNDPADPVIGNPKGDVTIIEWFDNECPYCKGLAPQIDQVIALDPNVRVVMGSSRDTCKNRTHDPKSSII